MSTKQSKKLSVLESITNTAIGLISSYMIQLTVFPWFNIHMSHATNIKITLIFFVASFFRSYLIRRFFNTIKS